MTRVTRFVLLTLLLVALPMRGYAGTLMSLCDTHHSGIPESHEHDAGHHVDSGDGDGPAHTPSMCSICASCCAGASATPDAARVVLPQIQGSDRIFFSEHRRSGFVPEQLDRPPLAS